MPENKLTTVDDDADADDDADISTELDELRQGINGLTKKTTPIRGGRRRGSLYAKKKRTNPAKRTKRNRNKKSNRRRASRRAY
jgi:hypothetical protein